MDASCRCQIHLADLQYPLRANYLGQIAYQGSFSTLDGAKPVVDRIAEFSYDGNNVPNIGILFYNPLHLSNKSLCLRLYHPCSASVILPRFRYRTLLHNGFLRPGCRRTSCSRMSFWMESPSTRHDRSVE